MIHPSLEDDDVENIRVACQAAAELLLVAWRHTRLKRTDESLAVRPSKSASRSITRTFPEHRFGSLRFVPRSRGPSLLVVDGLRSSFSKPESSRGFRRAIERTRRSGQGLTTVVMFLLVLSKRLGVARAAERWSGELPMLIEQQLRAEQSNAGQQGRFKINAPGILEFASECFIDSQFAVMTSFRSL